MISKAKHLRWLSLTVLAAMLGGCIEPTTSIRRTGTSGEVPSTRPAARTQPADPQTYSVQPGDTLFRIAFRYQTTVEDLVRWNGIADPNRIRVGQTLRIGEARMDRVDSIQSSTPSTSSHTETSNLATAPGASTTALQTGTSGVLIEPDAPAQVGVPADAMVSTSAPSQRLPEVQTTTASAAATSTLGSATSTAATSMAPPTPTASSRPTLDPEATLNAPPSAQDVTPVASPPTASGVPPSAVRNGWSWPTSGRLVGSFVAGDATRSGIDISGNEGQAVYAAADGEVVYSGTGIIGYGELIVVQHANGLLSAYGHNRKRLVNEGASVKRGQQIAEMGRDASGRQLLHFEVRKSGKPVDPLAHLPGR